MAANDAKDKDEKKVADEQADEKVADEKQAEEQELALREQLKAEILAELLALREAEKVESISIEEDGETFTNEAEEGGRYVVGGVLVDANGERVSN